MKILHVCLAAFYIDNYGYQENILPKMHKRQGHEVKILASTETYANNKVLGYVEPSEYVNENGIPVKRIPYVKYLPFKVVRKLRIYSGIKLYLEDVKPDIIFIHDSQFISIKEIVKYVKRHPNTTVYVDSHTDFINSGKNWVSINILHKVIYRWCAQKISPFVKKFWGTLPLRIDFYHNVYGIPKEKIDLLVFGVDTTLVDFDNKLNVRKTIRRKLGIPECDTVIITGGKIDRRKNIHNLLAAFEACGNHNFHLIVFGMPNEEMKKEYSVLSNVENVYSVGWVSPKEISEYMFASDIAIFPGTHSVVWEQAIGLGLPCVFKRWKGIEHLDLGGNCLFLQTGKKEELLDLLKTIGENPSLITKMQTIAVNIGMKEFSYYEIAKKAIETKNG